MLDLVLAIVHHLLVFSLVAVLAAEATLLRPGLTSRQLRTLAGLDAVYGATAGGVLAAGLARVFFGAKPESYYLGNPMFWAKIGAFAVVALLSIIPTLRILNWRRSIRADAAFTPTDAQVGGVRRFVILELIVFPLIPAFAAMMARGVGL